MPLICSTDNIMFSLVRDLNKDDFEEIFEASDKHNNYDGIIGFICNGKFTHPHDVEEQDDAHWSTEFCKAFPGEYILVIKGPPTNTDTILATFIDMENDWYNQHNEYDLWTTPVGYVAVC